MLAHRALSRIPLMTLAGLSIVIVAGIAALLLSFGVARANHWVTHSIHTQVGIVAVGERLSAFESGYRGFLIRRNPALLADAETARRDLMVRLADLARDTADDPLQKRNQTVLARLIERRLNGASQIIDLRRRVAINDLPSTARAQKLMRLIRVQIAAMFAEEGRLLAIRQQWLQMLTVGLGLFLVGAVLIVVVVAYLTVSDATMRYVELQRAHDETQVEMGKRELAENQLRQMQKMETIGQLAGGIAHDFNNMLAVIIGSLDLARRHGLDKPDRVAHGIATALDGAERAAGLVARLLAFSRNQPLSPVALDANRMIGGMAELLHRTLGEQFMIDIRLAADPWLCFADPVQLENAILNLAVNARDAMEERSGRLTISTANVAIAAGDADATVDLGPGDYVVVAVADTGHGMSADVIERAFDPFFTTKGVGKGTGLGLSQVFGFAKQSGGHVTIASRIGQGTTVRLHLPRYRGIIASPDAGVEDTVIGGHAGEIVLVVEDEPHVRHFSANALRELGYTVLTADNGDAALRILRDTPGITLLFTDIMMPGMSGRALAEAARRLQPSLRLLYTTGYARDDAGRDAPGDGGAILPKPFTIAQLAMRIRRALEAG